MVWGVGARCHGGCQTLAGLKKPCTSVSIDRAETVVVVGTESGVLRMFDLTELKKRECLSPSSFGASCG